MGRVNLLCCEKNVFGVDYFFFGGRLLNTNILVYSIVCLNYKTKKHLQRSEEKIAIQAFVKHNVFYYSRVHWRGVLSTFDFPDTGIEIEKYIQGSGDS